MTRTTCIVFILLMAIPCVSSAGTLEFVIKGIDDGVTTNQQQDYKEAVMNAKLQAIEQAGKEIQAITRIANFQTRFDLVERKAAVVLMPGYQIMDIGYLKDGTYQIVLTGKLRAFSKETSSGLKVKTIDQPRPKDFDGRFVAYKNGVILDTKTYLEWYGHSDKELTWYQARNWVETLKVDGGGWKMPSIDQLKTLFNTKKFKMTPLNKVNAERVWASRIKDFSTAWLLDFSVGIEFKYDKSITLTDCRALAVRPRK